jgi:hypothetical protein
MDDPADELAGQQDEDLDDRQHREWSAVSAYQSCGDTQVG